MKTTLDLPDDLVQELKLRSVRERKKLKDVAAQVIRRGLQTKESPPSETPPMPEGLMLNEYGFPIFRCSRSAPASRMSTEESLALEQESQLEEDLQRAGISR